MDNNTDILIYQTEDGTTKIDVRLENGTVWMTQKAIAELYQKGINTINEHIKNIYIEGELDESSTIRKNRIVQDEGDRRVEREVSFYNLEIIIAIGYRVRSHRGTQFRRWATERLNEYLVKGFTMNDERLKEMKNLGEDYLTEKEIKSLNRIVTMYLDYAEDQAERKKTMYMKDWDKKLNAFLEFNDRDILNNAGEISKKVAEQLAIQEYEKFNQKGLKNTDEDDFDRFIKENNLKGKR